MGEIKSLFMYYQLAYEQLMRMNSKLQIFIPTLPHLREEIIERTKKWKMDTIIIMDDKQMENYFLKTKIALVCSGTASLEIAKRGIPQLVIYKLNYFTELIASFFIRIKFANILNILENKMIIPEITNSNLKKNVFIKQFNNLLVDEESNYKQIEKVNKAISKIELLKPPFEIAVEGIKKFL
jgi:lipid-A-disaccharide synthase